MQMYCIQRGSFWLTFNFKRLGKIESSLYNSSKNTLKYTNFEA